jgi:hypothetical protein
LKKAAATDHAFPPKIRDPARQGHERAPGVVKILARGIFSTLLPPPATKRRPAVQD